MTAMFDTLKFARALRDGGSFTPEQAERLSDALSEAISGEVAARADLEVIETALGRKIDDSRIELERKIEGSRAELERKIEGSRTELERKIDDSRIEIERKIDHVRADLRIEISGMEAKIEGAKADTIKWVVGIISFQTVAIVGAAVVLARILSH